VQLSLSGFTPAGTGTLYQVPAIQGPTTPNLATVIPQTALSGLTSSYAPVLPPLSLSVIQFN
jgi:hypothetical protein